MAGYSGTPLTQKLGIKPGFRLRLLQAPENFISLLGPLPEDVVLAEDNALPHDLVHFFTNSAAELHQVLPALRSTIKPNGCIWISWPKKASGLPTDVTEDVVRSLALSVDLVDVKVCAVDEVWSGLKLVIPLHLRSHRTT